MRPQFTDATYKIVIGLEVHTKLNTSSKLFCGCSSISNSDPNTNTCPTCLGLPGSLPSINSKAIELSIRAGTSLNCSIPSATKWDRKHYFYPDSPKGYQTTQVDLPIASTGWLEIESKDKDVADLKKIRINRAHLEEDAGKSVHKKGCDTIIDLNRCGVPLLEIVSEPDLNSSDETKAYLIELRTVLMQAGVSDCSMQNGEFRIDVNINLHIELDQIPLSVTPVVEIKNLNSFRSVEKSIKYESNRQWKKWLADGGSIRNMSKQTRGWDEDREVTAHQREKEGSSDYRYFPCPDLAKVCINKGLVNKIRLETIEPPTKLRLRLQNDLGLSHLYADCISSQKPEISNYFLRVVELGGDPKQVANWIVQSILPVIRLHNKPLNMEWLPARSLLDLIIKIKDSTIPKSRSKEVFKLLIETQMDIDKIVSKLGIKHNDGPVLSDICLKVLDSNPKIVADVIGGNSKAIGPLIGCVKALSPNSDPKEIRTMCIELISENQT